MPDLTRGLGADDDKMIVAQALGGISEEDRTTTVPVRIEDAVMRAWDTCAMRIPERRRSRMRAVWVAALAAAACVVLAAALWLPRTAATDVAPVATEVIVDPLDAIATTGVLLQDDPASLRLVRMSVDPSVLAAYGYPLANPTDMQPVDVDVLIGLDGVPRVIRPVDTGGIWSVQ